MITMAEAEEFHIDRITNEHKQLRAALKDLHEFVSKSPYGFIEQNAKSAKTLERIGELP